MYGPPSFPDINKHVYHTHRSTSFSCPVFLPFLPFPSFSWLSGVPALCCVGIIVYEANQLEYRVTTGWFSGQEERGGCPATGDVLMRAA